MKKNTLLYNASLALVHCARYVRPVDIDYAQELLDKAQEYSNEIVIDEELEKEVDDFEQRIRKGIK